MKDPKENLKTWKLIMSSLFARTMPFVITGISERDWLFTNVIPEQIQNRTLSPDSVLQFVKFKDPGWQDQITDAFPLLKSASMILNITTVSGFINKFGIDKCHLVLENQMIRLKIDGKDDQAQLADLPSVGRLLSQYEMNYYLGYYDHYVSRKNMKAYTAIISKIDDKELLSAKSTVDYVRIRTFTSSNNEWRWFRVPLLDGFNYPSMYEYGKKSGMTDHILNAELMWRQRSVELTICYDDAKISVRSICPKRLFYPLSDNK